MAIIRKLCAQIFNSKIKKTDYIFVIVSQPLTTAVPAGVTCGMHSVLRVACRVSRVAWLVSRVACHVSCIPQLYGEAVPAMQRGEHEERAALEAARAQAAPRRVVREAGALAARVARLVALQALLAPEPAPDEGHAAAGRAETHLRRAHRVLTPHAVQLTGVTYGRTDV